ncbi:MAG TPA: bifunctional 4-hydroxy-2-oxoglutarate aldolase/2-dehydro-3-deoxy-phosphogluconate aldolase [Victivallales bacterium]|nr:bifunctional 4-hydroxy-2-oxoglutarate aldolase/2-dehydro-3-deoxy-phosphogluconate aldolase [Victivallales bacterium]HPO91336.1 bifunctional 4-hydroxy-2-oxoglutarate aldolase/2-dehydro-3-deoxy-phosphogluconate aldolase [Victivallales bacterium]HRR28371.1 bifunctional 4-hydroxy-2-oxoglutarate aldolase/2-dehydro-3-deoxy-phosphogluconate aldolase [Victivallales bacterium]HRU00167.1 bifunctional 4-hydroxy-2-oxoglutarate aldolase/2-dehydro-3-deoxy-phosphogluconate aldolase [Victivallales bacterium]
MKVNERIKNVVEFLFKYRIVPVLILPDIERGLKVCEILLENSLPVAEITFRTSVAASIIKEVSKRFPEILLGAGTILNVDDLKVAVDAGAKFAVSPGTNPKILAESVNLEMPFFPGISTPSDIERALEFNCKIFKFFPAEPLGGLKMLNSIAAPYRHLGVKFIPLGGINLQNMQEYLKSQDVIAIGGSWLLEKDILENENWARFSENIKLAILRKI